MPDPRAIMSGNSNIACEPKAPSFTYWGSGSILSDDQWLCTRFPNGTMGPMGRERGGERVLLSNYMKLDGTLRRMCLNTADEITAAVRMAKVVAVDIDAGLLRRDSKVAQIYSAAVAADSKHLAIADDGETRSRQLNIKISEVIVGERIRQDCGDVDALAASIAELGLLQPIIIDEHRNLLAGERRLRAVEKLGWTTIPATIAREPKK
jgi:ParB-like nuclease domain